MTCPMRETVTCLNCSHVQTNEVPFLRWMRNAPELSSGAAGLVRYDLDVLLHKYMHLTDCKGSRDVQAMMFVEVKTHLAKPDAAQRDTLHILNQVLNNRRPNMHRKAKGSRASSPAPVKAYSPLNRRPITLFLLGGHLLQLSGSFPGDSPRMLWDKKLITPDQLVGLLRFELDPHEPTREIDWRRRSMPFKEITEMQKRLFDLQEIA